jgi:methionine-rich copper-binding protein CopC
MRKIVAAAMMLLLPGGMTGAHAHAFLDHADPRVGSTVPTAPREVTMTFTQELEAAFSSAEVRDEKGARVDQGRPQISGTVMRVGLKPLPAGAYKVHWKALSVDTHTTEGNFSFRVGK